MNMIKKIAIVAQNFLFPPHCVLCSQDTPRFSLCRTCLKDLPRIQHACHQCAQPLLTSATCGQCLRQAPPFDSCITCFYYDSPIKDLLYQFKMNQALSLAPLFARLMAHRIKLTLNHAPKPTYLLPMPLHPKRIRYRGFNPSLEIAKHLYRDLEIPLNRQLARRIIHTNTQSELPFNERKRNVKDVFHAPKPIKASIAILDDVMTTGATAASLAKTLKKAGCPYVTVWCLAKTTLDSLT